MRVAFLLFIHLIVTIVKLIGPGGARGVIAETLAVKHQLLIASRSRQRAPNLTPTDRALLGIWSLLIRPHRLPKVAVVVSLATLHRFHDALKKRKYRRLFSAHSKGKPGPQGPSQELINAIVEMKMRNPRFGCPRIAQQLSKAFGIEVDKDVVRRVLAKHYWPLPGGGGPSWLTVIGHTKDSLWSVDLFRCESILLTTHWVMVVMDQFTRRIIGFGIQVGDVDGPALCRMFNQAVAGQGVPTYLSSDNDPLFLFHQWKANLRILEIQEIKTVAHVPVSHPFVERLIGTLRREQFDQVFFWNVVDLESKLEEFKTYFNEQRTHAGIEASTPAVKGGGQPAPVISLDDYRWQRHCGGLFQLPVAA
jgi:transposase InsO family protein